MTLIEQCQEWHDRNEHDKIIEAIEALDESERNERLDGLLARAYNNIADPDTDEGRAYLKKAIRLLMKHKARGEKTALWNFRVGYALFYLQQPDRAWTFFKKAHEFDPDDDDTKVFLKGCEELTALPNFTHAFRRQASRCWAWFALDSESMISTLKSADTPEAIEAVHASCERLFGTVIEDVEVKLYASVDEPKALLRISAPGGAMRYRELKALVDLCPAKVLDLWDITMGEPRCEAGLEEDESPLRALADCRLALKKTPLGRVDVKVYWVSLEEAKAMIDIDQPMLYWMAEKAMKAVLGESLFAKCIRHVEWSEKPIKGKSLLVTELPEALNALGCDIDVKNDVWLKHTTDYQGKAATDLDLPLRRDIVFGSTQCPWLIEDYDDEDTEAMEMMTADRVTPGFFAYRFAHLSPEEQMKAQERYQRELRHLLSDIGESNVSVVGEATGVHFNYLDVIAWEIEPIVEIVMTWAAKQPFSEFYFQPFRADVTPTNALKGKKLVDQTRLELPEYTPETKANILKRLEEYAQATNSEASLRWIEAVPEAQRDFDLEVLYAHLLMQNAMLHKDGVEKDALLTKAIAHLQQFEDQGAQSVEWVQWMAHGYFWLNRPKEALFWAEAWIKLDAEDQSAQRFMIEIEKRLQQTEDSETMRRPFLAIMLLKDNVWDPEAMIEQMKTLWGLDATLEYRNEGLVEMRVNDVIVEIEQQFGTVKEEFAQQLAATNYRWAEAGAVVAAHRDALVIRFRSVRNDALKALERKAQGMLFSKVVLALSYQPNAMALIDHGVVRELREIQLWVKALQENVLPIPLWIWVGLFKGQSGYGGYTIGMRDFGYPEFEVPVFHCEPQEIMNCFYDLAFYAIGNDVKFESGSRVTLGQNDFVTLTLSKGVNFHREETLKVELENSHLGELKRHN